MRGDKMNAIGIDIGTTSICGVAIDVASGEVLKVVERDNDTFIESDKYFEVIQNPNRILEIVREILAELDMSNCAAIGFSGQMHGILYLDNEGNPLSPLYTWQDRRGDEIYRDGKTYAQYLTETYNCPMATGFGFTTHFYNIENNLAPKGAQVCSIADFAAMKLVNASNPIMHPTMSASFGVDFANALPEVADGYHIVGKTDGGIPVSVAIGDNQASFLGSVRDMENSVLVNVGTGSQVSVTANEVYDLADLEFRPYVGGKFLLVGRGLQGGRTFAELAAQFGGYDSIPPKLAEECLTKIARELYEKYEKMNVKTDTLVASGNGIRKNPALQKVFINMFSATLEIPKHKEEAAYGAALFALAAAGHFESISEAQKLIKTEVTTQ